MSKKQHTRREMWRTFRLFVDNALTHNIVLIQALGLCPVIATATTLQNGVVMSACTAAVLLPMSLLVAAMGNWMPKWLRPAVYAVVASLLLVGASYLLEHYISAELYAKLHHFIPLIAVNMLYARNRIFSSIVNPVSTIVDALGSTLGFGLVICAVSAIREVIAYGTLWNQPLDTTIQLPQIATPFTAFIMLGFMAAALQWSRRHIAAFFHRKEEEE